MDVIIVVVLFATVVLRVVFVAALAYLILPRDNQCPHCGMELQHVHSRWSVLTGLERRFCLECGWAGLGRRTRPPAFRGPPAPG